MTYRMDRPPAAKLVPYLYTQQMLDGDVAKVPYREWYDWVAVYRSLCGGDVGRKLTPMERRHVLWIRYVYHRWSLDQLMDHFDRSRSWVEHELRNAGIPGMLPVDQVAGLSHVLINRTPEERAAANARRRARSRAAKSA
jgi:hypothetical protein